MYNTIHYFENIKNFKNTTNFSKKSGFDRFLHLLSLRLWKDEKNPLSQFW